MNDDETAATPNTAFVRRHYANGPTAYFEDGRIAKMPTDEDVAFCEKQFNRWLAAHDAALLEAQSAAELALYKTRARWVQVLVAELNADLDRTEAERDAARATIDEALAEMRDLVRDIGAGTEFAEGQQNVAELVITILT